MWVDSCKCGLYVSYFHSMLARPRPLTFCYLETWQKTWPGWACCDTLCMFEFCRLLFQQWLETEGTSPYICFLSNPQDLDIASFRATVETSPFYVALQNMPSSGQMIMVATANNCTDCGVSLKAHMAMQCGIPILPG